MKRPTHKTRILALEAMISELNAKINLLVKQAVQTHENVVFLSDQVDVITKKTDAST